MTSLNDISPAEATITTPHDLEAAISYFADRCYALPPAKQKFLLGILAQGPAIHAETFDMLLLMLENSDDNFNITNPELNQLIAEATEAHKHQEANP